MLLQVWGGGRGGEKDFFLLLTSLLDEPSSQYMPRGKGWWNQKVFCKFTSYPLFLIFNPFLFQGIASSGKKNFFNSGFMLLMSGTVTVYSFFFHL